MGLLADVEGQTSKMAEMVNHIILPHNPAQKPDKAAHITIRTSNNNLRIFLTETAAQA